MANLNELQLGSVRTLVAAASDSALRDLQTSLSTGSGRHEGMRAIQQMVAAETSERLARVTVFAPLAPLCSPPREGWRGMLFPPSALVHVWRALKLESPREIQAATIGVNTNTGEPLSGTTFDGLCLQAAVGLRARSNPSYEAAANLLDKAHPNGAELFASYLDITPVARAALDRMPEWLGRLNDERAAAMRVAFKDAVDVAEDAGPRLLEILFAHLEEPWAILRVVSAVMHRPSDKYVANSELASFGVRLMDDIDDRLKIVVTFNPDGGENAGLVSGGALRMAALEIYEFDESVELSGEGPWGSRLNRQKRGLVQTVEGKLKVVENHVSAALPIQSPKTRGARGHPRLNQEPDARLVSRARAYLTFMHEARHASDKLGYGTLWNKAAESLQIRLDTYVEDLLDMLRTGEEGDDPERVKEFLDIAAEFLGLAFDERAAQIVRRRMAAAA